MNQRTLTVQNKPILDDAVCPGCIRCQPETRISDHAPIKGVQHRTYFGWCHICKIGYEVIQFKPAAPFDKGRWLLYKYRRTVYAGGLPIFDSWVQVNRIEQPAAFASHYAALEPNTHQAWTETIDEVCGYSDEEMATIEKMYGQLKKLAQVVDNVANAYGQFHGIDND